MLEKFDAFLVKIHTLEKNPLTTSELNDKDFLLKNYNLSLKILVL